MFRNLRQKIEGQNTAEYAILIALVVAGVIAMQTYTQRSLQAKMRDAGKYLSTSGDTQLNGITASQQYEPYYQNSTYQVTKGTSENKRQAAGTVAQDTTSNRSRTGSQEAGYTGETGY